jgi:threonylcarbamoyladenosine tRNA methylthiotransferase MtaB
MRPKVSLHTLGCKVNQYDTAAIGRALQEDGMEVVHGVSEADVFVVNSCTVTASTDRQNRQLIRRLRRDHPGALMVVTGCQAEVFPEALSQMGEVDLIVGNRYKGDLPKLILESLRNGSAELNACYSKRSWWGMVASPLPGHTRAYIKIQDGCEASCTYCVVPRARGRSRSRPFSSIRSELRRMEAVAVQEVVLTGIRLGLYGRDLSPQWSLVCLLEHILKSSNIPRIRLSSLEPLEITDELVGCMRDSERICPHLHVPLQSGDDEILRLMNRPYRSDQYRDRILRASAEIRDLTLGCDVIVGFPGETPAHFQRTIRFLGEIPFTYLHVFPFSPRRGTPAEQMPHRLPSEQLKSCSKTLRTISHKRLRDVMTSYVGRTMFVLVEQAWRERDGWMQGLTSNYLRVMIPGDEHLKSQIVPVRLERVEGRYLLGRFL